MDFFFTMDRKRKLGCVLFNNLLTSSRKRRRKEQDEFDAMYQSFEEPAEVIDDGEDDDIMGTIAYGVAVGTNSNKRCGPRGKPIDRTPQKELWSSG